MEFVDNTRHFVRPGDLQMKASSIVAHEGYTFGRVDWTRAEVTSFDPHDELVKSALGAPVLVD